MSHEPDVGRTVAVSDDDVRVEKSFAREEFPVPAIKFRLVSESEDPVHVRLVDRIPEDFPMESVGFHPDYESDNWTAYKDHRVEYERTLEPGESTVTVYGIRLDESTDVAGFLGEPILERPPVPGEAPEDRTGTDVDDILGTDRSQLVRDALQGNGRLANQDPTDPAEPGVEPAADDGETAVDAGGVSDADAEAGTAVDVEGVSDTDAEADAAVEAAEEAPDADAEAAVESDAEKETHAAAEAAEGAPEGEPETDAETDDTPETPEPRETASDLRPAVHREADSVTPVADADEAGGDGSEAEPDAAADAGSAAGDDADTSADTESEADTDAYVDIGAEAEGDVAATESDAADTAGDAATTESDATPTTGADAAEGGLAATLAAEIRAGEVSEADLETLRGELDPGLPRSADVRIRRLQSQLADLETYTDALEEFIDDEGTGAELVERLDAELEEVTAELESVREDLDAAAADREGIREEIDAVDDDLAATDERLDAVDETATEAEAGVEDLHDRADTIEGHLDDVDADVDSIVEELDDLGAEIDGVAAALDDTDEYVSDLDDDIEDVRAEVSAVGDDLEDARTSLSADIADLRAEVTALTDELDRLGDIEADIEQLQTFRDRLNSAFGPGGGAGGDDDGK